MDASLINILLVEDDEDDYVLFEDLISEIEASQFKVDRAKSYQSALEALNRGGYDICFLDYRLGAHTGLEILKQVPSIGFDSPIVFLTGQGDYNVDLQAMEAGAADYLVKGNFDSADLERVIRYSLARRDLQQALTKARDELELRVEERTFQLAAANKELQNEIEIRRATEKALQESESRLNAIIFAVPDIIYRLDKNGMITFISSAVKEYGYSPKNLLEKPIMDLVHYEDREKVIRCIHERRTRKRRTTGVELRLLRGDMTLQEPDVNADPKANEPVFLLSSEGLYEIYESGDRSYVGSQGILRDITALKQEEARRQKLELQVKQAEKLEALGTFSGGIAHDFNNILTAILGNINLAQDCVDPKDEVFTLLGAAETATLQAADLTRKFITFSKGGAPMKQNRLISEVLKKVCDSIFSESHAEFRFSFPEDQWTVGIDEDQMIVALNGIFYNAIEAMPDGGTVKVKVDNISYPEDVNDTFVSIRDGRYERVSIQDHGCGIPPKLLPYIFDPYFTTKEMGTQKGLGLSLSVVHSIIERHGGYIFAESEVNKGTTINVYLPASDYGRELFIGVPHPATVKKRKILVMDDEKSLRVVSGNMLDHLGYEVETAADGVEALALYKDALDKGEGFEVVVLDLIVADGMGGKETMQKLKEIDPDVKAIISTGYSYDSIIKDYVEFGFKEVLPKPYNLKQLSDVLLRTVGENQ